MILEGFHTDGMMSLEPHYCDLVLFDKPWSGLGFLTSLFIHQTDQSFNFDLREEEGISYDCFSTQVGQLTSSDIACRCMMQEKPAHTIDLRSSITTWASKTFPVLMGLVRLHRTKPGESSSSEMPLTLALIFSPEVTAVTSMSSDQICSILTSLYDG